METYEIENALYDKSLPTFSHNKTKYEQVLKIISTFDEYERSLFLLYYESNMTYEELSKEIGIPKISIYNAVRKVKRKVWSKLNKEKK